MVTMERGLKIISRVLTLMMILQNAVCQGVALTPTGCYPNGAAAQFSNLSSQLGLNSSMTVSHCCFICRQISYLQCYLSETKFCQCSNTVPSVSSSNLCTGKCAGDNLTCGALPVNGTSTIHTSVYSSGGGSPNFTLITMATASTVTLTAQYTSSAEDFYVNFGDGTPTVMMISSGPTFATPLYKRLESFQPYTAPNTYNIAVIGTINGTSQVHVETFELNLPGVPSIDLVSCPYIAYTDVIYNCNVSVNYQNDTHFYNLTYSDASATPNILSKIGNAYTTVGTPTPRGPTPDAANDGAPLGAEIILIHHPITFHGILIAVDILPYLNDSFSLSLLIPNCGSLKYCSYLATCLAVCPDDLVANTFSCTGTAFCPLDDTCCTGNTTGTSPTWIPYPIGVTTTGRRNVMLRMLTNVTGVTVAPGWVLKVAGSVTRRLQSGSGGDIVNGSQTDYYHYIMMTIKELVNVSIQHTCRTILQNVTLTAIDTFNPTNVYHGPVASTICERNITDLQISLNQTEPNAYNSLINLVNPFYVWTGNVFQILATISQAGPLYFNITFTPTVTANITEPFPNDYPNMTGPYVIPVPRTISSAGAYEVSIVAFNSHNILPDPITGLVRGGIMENITIYALNPVSPTWTVAPPTNSFLVPRDVPTIMFADSNTSWPFPSNATVTIDWGDGTPVTTMDFLDPGTLQPVFNHSYAIGGIYILNCSIHNAVSGISNLNTTITIYQHIVNFNIINKYLPSVARGLQPGAGLINNQYPVDKNLTFLPFMTNGTVESFEIRFTNNGSLIENYTVTDKFHPMAFSFDHHFDYPVTVNMTVFAINIFENVSVDLYVEMVGLIRGLQLDDYSIVTKGGDLKTFVISFESYVGRTCVVIDFGDRSYTSFGDQTNCLAKFSHVLYDPTIELTSSFNITHVYATNGPYNISVIAFNDLNRVSAMMLFMVTDVQCRPPTVIIIGQVTDFLSATKVFKGKDNKVTALANIDCSATQQTTKRWQIFLVNGTTGEQGPPIFVMYIVPSWNNSELLIPTAFLNYGYYLLTYTIAMYDPPKLDKSLTFQKQLSHYIYVSETPIVAKLTASPISQVTRGLSQSVRLQPAIYSVDPDFPNNQSFKIAWKCRSISENFTTNTTPLPVTIGTSGTGCFGNGPGYVAQPKLDYEIFGKDFLSVGTYVMTAEVMNNTRTSPVSTTIQVVTNAVPILSVNCSSDVLCVPSEDGTGVYINPNSRFGLLATCISDCSQPATFSWLVYSLPNDSLVTLSGSDTPIGTNNSEFSLATSFFDSHPNILQFRAVLQSPSGSSIGSSSFIIYINQRPTGGLCSLDKYVGIVLIDTFTLTCSSWVDPDLKGIDSYIVRTIQPGKTPTTVMEQSHVNFPLQVMTLMFPVGEYAIQITIKDVGGATTLYVLPSNVTVNQVTEAEFAALDSSALIARLVGGGNVNMLNMVISARNSIINTASWLNVNDGNISAAEQQSRMLAINDMYTEEVTALKQTMNFNTQGGAEAAAGILSDIMEKASLTPNGVLTIDLFTRGDIYDLLDKMVTQIGLLPIGTPEDLRKLVESVSTIAAGLVVGTAEVSSPGCQNIPPKDSTQNANAVDYDTEIKSIDMVIPSDVMDAKKCNIMDLTKSGTTLQMPRLQKIMDRMSMYVIEKQVPGESMKVATRNNMTVQFQMLPGYSLAGRHPCGNSWIEFPATLCPQGSFTLPVGLSLKEWPTVTYISTPSASLLTGGSRVFDVNIYDKDMNLLEVVDFPDTITLSLYRTLYGRGNNSAPDSKTVFAQTESESLSIPIMYTKFTNTKIGVGISIEITPLTGNFSLLFLMIMRGELPTFKNYDNYTLVEDIPNIDNGTYTYFIESSPTANMTGDYYIGIGEFMDSVDIEAAKNLNRSIASFSNLRKPMTVDYNINILTSGCYFYDGQNWLSDNVQTVGTEPTSVNCVTNHLTTFGGGLFVMPNTIDFSYVFANMAFSDNLTIYVTLIICISIFIILMIWAKFKDCKDLKKLGASPLPDNMAEDKYLYEIMVFTGHHKEAQTDSTVQFIVSGDYGDSDVRTFGDSQRKIFRKGAVDIFVMASPKSLGPLTYIRLWHDNSGAGPNASWYLSFIVFRDIQTGQKYEFICNDWLAVEKSDGQLERILGIAGRDDKTDFGHLFQNTSNKSLTEGHIWFSIFMRPPRSRFTRCQRVASCFALLFLSMLVNAMWYNTVPSQAGNGGFSLGPLNLTPAQIAVGLISNLIVFPPSFLIIFLFKYSKPRKLRKSRIQEALKRASKEALKSKRGDDWEENEVEDEQDKQKEEEVKTKNTNFSKKKDKKRKNRKWTIVLPWWCKYLAWLLVVICIAVSVFFLLSYGIMFGNEKASKWITSLVVSFLSSLFFVQPLKVMLVTLLLSLICKKMDLDEDDADVDEETPDLQDDELWLFEGEKTGRLGYGRVNDDLLAELRQKRLKEIENGEIVMELFGYGAFLLILLIISYGEKDPNSYYLKDSLMQSFIHFGAIDGSDFSAIATTDDFWIYLPLGLMIPLRADKMYNGAPPYQLRGFLNDYNNRIMGYATIRQIRAKKNTCTIPALMSKVADDCSGFTLLNEESRNYCLNWTVPDTLTRNTSTCQVPEFKYETAAQLKSLPIWGARDWYGGGGYTIHLSGATRDILDRFTFLQENHWIDKMTRAVIIEFSTYNSQVNLFGICTIMAEFLPGSGITPNYRFDAINLFPTQNNYGNFIVACEIIFCIFTIYFTIHELGMLCKLKKSYFDSYWSYAELAMIAVSYGAILLYFWRNYETTNAVQVFKNTFGNGYVKMNYAAAINEYYGYAIAFLVFVGTIKFIKLLRFNKRMGFLSATLAKCWEELVGFMMAFCICFFSFVLLFFFLLSTLIVDFSTVTGALATCFSMMMGKFQFNEMKDANPMAPVMFFVFVLCTSWVLVNLLLTLIMRSFEEVKADINNQQDEYQIVDFMFNKFKNLIGKEARTNHLRPKRPLCPEEHKSQEQIDENVTELPSKIDRFLDYVNAVYFDGTMDLKSKDNMKESLFRPRQIHGAEVGIGVDRGTFGRSQDVGLISPRSTLTGGE